MSNTARPFLANRDARRLFLQRHGLSEGFGGPLTVDGLAARIDALGFVQIDSIQTVARAHHMILSARARAYRPSQLTTLAERRRGLFEHWTHDAAFVPIEFYPHWRLRFERHRERLTERWRKWRRDGFEERFDDVLEHVARSGPVMARDVGGDEPRNSGGWWDWHPSKTALEFLWRTGALAVTGRRNFQKVFDLAERVIPADTLASRPEAEETVDWAARSALDRLGFATTGEIANFWETIFPAEAMAWAEPLVGRDLVQVDVEGADGKVRALLARPDVLEAAAAAPPAPDIVRVLSPFDPALRDRRRAEQLFGFRYRIEIFVPAEKRVYGYYVFPVLEGDRLAGRIDMKRDRDRDALVVTAFWPERGVRAGKGRLARLERELDRQARFAGGASVVFEDGWLKEPK